MVSGKAKPLGTGQPLDRAYADEKGRLFFYDNAKFILIFLVVLGHLIEPFRTSGQGSAMFLFAWRIINTLHMPAMIFISGFFAKKYIRPDGSFNVQRPFTYMVYYLVAEIVFGALEVYVLGVEITKSILQPRSALWFLMCLAWWYLLLPAINKIEPKYMLTIAVVVGVFIGYDSQISNFLAFSRMMTHFPFFLMGYYISSEKMQFVLTKKAKILSLPVLLLSVGSIVVIMFLFRSSGPFDFNINWIISCDKSYFKVFKNKGISPVFWFLPRVWFYLCAVGLGFSFLAWVPRKKTFFTKLGARTLGPYILHMLIIFLYRSDKFAWATYDWFKYEWLGWKNIFVLRIIMIPAAFLLTLLLSQYPFYWPFEMLGKIKIKKILKKETD